jgi:hypothetical protein
MPMEDAILGIIKATMPGDAEIQVVSGVGALNIGVSWKLNDDPERPNKMSKTIRICVSHEAAQDLNSAAQHQQTSALRRVSYFLAQKFSQFDPRHDTPKNLPPPVETWIIDTKVIGG